MTRQSRNLLATILSTSALVMVSAPSFALDLPPALKYDMGPFGNWTVSGGVEAALSGWNNSIPRSGDRAPGVGNDTSGDIDLTNAIFILNSKGNMFGDFPLQFHAWIGE